MLYPRKHCLFAGLLGAGAAIEEVTRIARRDTLRKCMVGCFRDLWVLRRSRCWHRRETIGMLSYRSMEEGSIMPLVGSRGFLYRK